MITWEDLNPKNFPLTSEQQSNLILLAPLITAMEDAFGSLYKITSGFRSIEDHYRIYREMGIDHPPMGSQHLQGNAVDIYDPRSTLRTWLLTEKGLLALEKQNLYCEQFDERPRVHFQRVAPLSKKRFFLP